MSVKAAVHPDDASLAALIRRAKRIGASLERTKRRSIVIRRGLSSWHCIDEFAAGAVLHRLEARDNTHETPNLTTTP